MLLLSNKDDGCALAELLPVKVELCQVVLLALLPRTPYFGFLSADPTGMIGAR